MSSVICEVNLSPHDTYVLARAMVGLEWHDLPCSPLTRLILSHVDLSSPDDLAALRRFLGPEGLRAVLRVDPEIPLPEASHARFVLLMPEPDYAERIAMRDTTMLHDLGESEEARLEMRILKLLASNANGLSVRDIYRALRSPRKPVLEALKALEQDGQVEQHYARSGQHGPKAECYRLVGLEGP